MLFRRRDKEKTDESKEALKEAEENLNDIKSRGKEVTEVAKALKDLRERNHFAEQLEAMVFRSRGHYEPRH